MDHQKPSKKGTSPAHRAYSAAVVDGYTRAASRAMLRAVGFKSEDFKKNQIGIASPSSQVTPCNMHMDRLAKQVQEGENLSIEKCHFSLGDKQFLAQVK